MQDYATYTYSDNGQQTSVTDANNNQTAFTYDTFDRPLRTTYADTTFEENQAYDANGNPGQVRLRGGQTVYFTYDALNRVTFKNLPGSEPDVTTRFSRAGEVRIVSQSGLSNTYHYDAAGRVTSAVRSDGKTTAYAYDTAGNVTKLTYPGADNFFVTYAYDALGRLEEIRDKNTALLADYAYDLLSRRDGLELNANAASTAYAYDDASALDTLTHNLSGTTNDVTFTYLQNGVNQITQMTVSNPSAYLFAPAEDLSETVTVNAANQQTEVVRGPVLKFPLSYDTAGNLTSDGANLFGYDSQNRLVSAEMVGAGVDATYDYGPENRRFRKTVNASITSYAYDGGEAIAEYSGFGGAATLLRRYVYGPGIDEPVLKIEYNTGGAETGRLFYHADHQGSVIALSTTAGALSESFIYSPWGETSDSLSGNPYRYTGRRLDEETGLYYYRARYYSPVIGRFLSPDPIGYGDGLNLYAYVGNDPLTFTDPSGLAKNFIAETGQGLWDLVTDFLDTPITSHSVSIPVEQPSLLALARPELATNLDFEFIGMVERPLVVNDVAAPALVLGTSIPLGGRTAYLGRASGLGDLTVAEVHQIQRVVNSANRPLEVVGSAALGQRRGVGSNLPIGKGPGTRSDIDFLVPPSSLLSFRGLETRLPSLDSRGMILGVHNPHIGPAIRFEPSSPPFFLPPVTP